jgi:ankyrin repeat protein
MNSHSECIKILLEWGADVNIADKNGFTALHLASQRGYDECCKILLSNPCINVDAKDIYNTTSLHFACAHGHEACIRTLLDYGANVMEINDDGVTPFDIANNQMKTFIKEYSEIQIKEPNPC